MWMTGDLGACWLLDETLLQNPIKVVHWGLQVRWEGARGPDDAEAYVDAAMCVCVWAASGIVFAVQWHPQ